MTLNIKRPEAEQLAHTLAKLTGESITTAVVIALQERLVRVQGRNTPAELQDVLLKIAHRCATLPDQDTRSPEEILGYDQSGIPT